MTEPMVTASPAVLLREAGCFGRLERTIAELPARWDGLVAALRATATGER